MAEQKQISTKSVIITYSVICAIVAVQPIPFADIFILTPIQILMGVEIAKKYGVKVGKLESKEVVKQILGVIGMGIIAQQLGLAAARIFWPIFGSIATVPVVFGLSYGMGKMMEEYYKEKTKTLKK